MKGLRGNRGNVAREGTLIVTIDIGLTGNVGYCTTLDGRSSKTFKFNNIREGFEKFWGMVLASKNRFGCDEVPTPNPWSIIWRINRSRLSRST